MHNVRLRFLTDIVCCSSPQLSPAIVGGLHNIARSIESRSYTEGLNIHTHIVSNSNFSETSAFMPVLKVVLTQANKLGVWRRKGKKKTPNLSDWWVKDSDWSGVKLVSRGAAFDSRCRRWDISEMYENPVKFFYVPFMVFFLLQLKHRPCYQSHSVVKVICEPSANKRAQQLKGWRLFCSSTTMPPRHFIELLGFIQIWEHIDVWELKEYAKLLLKICNQKVSSYRIWKQIWKNRICRPILICNETEIKKIYRRFRNFKGFSMYLCSDDQNKCNPNGVRLIDLDINSSMLSARSCSAT